MKMMFTASHRWSALCLVSCVILDVSTKAARIKRAEDNFWQCSQSTQFISGFSTFKPTQNSICANRPAVFRGETTQCNWQPTNKSNEYSWNECPRGFFYQGFGYDEMLCCKPSRHLREYSVCYNQATDPTHSTECSTDHFVVGTEDMKYSDAITTKTLRCCQMFDREVHSDTELINRIKDETLMPLSYLSQYLGFGWCSGCRGKTVGDNFISTNSGWEADKSGVCEGYKADQRLKIEYSNWKIDASNVIFTEMEISEPVFESIYKGKINNSLPEDTVLRRSNTFTHTRTVSHTKLSAFTTTQSVTLKTQVSILSVFTASTEYSFSYENKEETTKSDENEDVTNDQNEIEIPIKACSVVEYEIVVSKINITQNYTADLQMGFAVALTGFLRLDTNFHESYQQSSDRPTITYQFGSDEVPFYDDLKYQSFNSVPPWKWRNMFSKYDPTATTVLNLLTNASSYQEKIKGQFRSVESTDFWIKITQVDTVVGCSTQGNASDGTQGANSNVGKRRKRSPDDRYRKNVKANYSMGSEALSEQPLSFDHPKSESASNLWRKINLKTGKLQNVKSPPNRVAKKYNKS